MRRLSVALVHHPVVGRDGAVMTTTVTNLDVHDIARSARTFGVSDYFVVHPIEAQRALVARIVAHWTGDGRGLSRIPDREPALSRVRVVATLADACTAAGDAEMWTTAARPRARSISFDDARAHLRDDGRPVLLVLGTGWGLADDVMERADAHLPPILGVDTYNHLSVRAAAAILLDRLVGDRCAR
ncbi:MAG: RNA methyltransferase [Polyangiaceae bacterium]|nr:RNA methyltransferase [Polyangiaceae bacterium]